MTSQDSDDHTRNHGYNTPPEGATDWHLDLNQNFDQIDTDVEIRDTEGNKGDYEPKEGAKYEATDSGAVYYGNGNSWVLADREVESIRAKNINDSLLTPENNTIQAIQDLIDEYRHPNIRLVPGTVYSGDTQLYIDSVASDGEGRDIRINAHGAAVEYTGDRQNAVMIQQGNIQDSESGITDDANDDNVGHIELRYGTWIGPGKEITEGAVIRQDSGFGNVIIPRSCQNAEHGLLVLNNNGWNEGNHFGFTTEGGYQGNELSSYPNCKYLLRLAGGGSSFSELSDDSSRNSMRNTRVTVEFHKAANEPGAITFWHDNVSLHGGQIRLAGFIPKGGTHYKLSGNLALNQTCTIDFESEGGDNDSVAIDLGDNTNTPFFINPRIQTFGTELMNSGNAGLKLLRQDGVVTKGGSPGSWKIQGSSPGNGTTWLEYLEEDETFRYGLGDEDDGLALVTNNAVSVINNERNRMPLKASKYEAGESGDQKRSIYGSFDDHPSDVSNGDTWYITGNGSPSEGFYGKTSSGVARLD